MSEPRSRFVTAGGRRLHLLEWRATSDSDPPVVVVLHGFTGHARQAELLAPALVGTHRVIALDQRGHGQSEPADVYGARPMVEDLVAVLDELGVERAALVGHSLGGIVAMAAGALHPGRVSALVLGDIGPEVAPEGIARIQRNVAARDVFTSVDDAYEQQAALNPTADPAALRHRVEHNLRELDDGTLTWTYDRALRDGTARHDHFTADEQWAFWVAIGVPVLILRGALSDVLSPDIAARMLAANPRARLVVIPGAGHSIATDAPAAVAEAVAGFLAA